MIQLASPNLSASGRIGWCLEYQSKLWGTTHAEPYAWTAWMNTKLHHSTPPPTDVAYPLWFSFFSGSLNEGHVVTFVPGQGYYSSPWQQGTTHAVLPSIAEVERIYGCKYVGWSEDILEKQVIKETQPMLNDGDTTNFYLHLLGHPPDQNTLNNRRGTSATKLFQDIIQSDEYKLKPTVPTDYTVYSGPQLFVKK